MSKKRILLCWGYHRKGWLHAFNALNDDFEFHYIFYIHKPEDELNFSLSNNLHYWSDFDSAQDIIKRINPQKIVFMSTEGISSTALNVVAKEKGIETLVVQHGMFHTYKDYLNLAKAEKLQRAKKVSVNKLPPQDKRFLLRFFLKSVYKYPMALFYMLKLQYSKRSLLEIEALKKVQSKFRITSKYIVFTKQNASIYYERDGVTEDLMVPIGNPEMDEFANYSHHENKESDYFLLIDQPWSEVKEYNSPGFGISKEQTSEFHLKLSSYSKSMGCKLKIKLHPYSYSSDFFPDDENIEYLKDANMVPYIMEAQGVFGFNSTLLIPAIYFNKCCLFRIWDQSSFQNEADDLEVATVLDYINFNNSDIRFKKPEQNSLDTFVTKYMYKTDGNSIKRLAHELSA